MGTTHDTKSANAQASGSLGFALGMALFLLLGIGGPVFLYHRSQIDHFSEKTNTAREARARVEKEHLSLTGHVAALEEGRGALQRNLETTDGQLKQSLRNLETVRREAAAAAKDLASQRESLVAATGELKTARDEITQRTEALSQTHRQLEDAKSASERLQSDLSSTRQAVELLKQQMARAEAQISEGRTEANNARAAAEKSAAEMAALRTGLEKSHAVVESTQSDLADAKARLSEAQSELSDARLRAETQERQLNLRKQEQAQLSERVTAQEREIEELRTGLRAAQEKSRTEERARQDVLEELAREREAVRREQIAVERTLEELATTKKALVAAEKAGSTAQKDRAEMIEKLESLRHPLEVQSFGRRVRRLRQEASDIDPTDASLHTAVAKLQSEAEVVLGRQVSLEKQLADLQRRAEPYDRADATRDREILAARHPDAARRLADLEALLRGDAASADERARLRLEVGELQKLLHRRTTYKFQDAADQWLHDALHQTVEDLSYLQKSLKSLEEKREEARLSHERGKHRWALAVESVRRHPSYEGLELTPEPGLLACGADPETGLYCFVDIESDPMSAAQVRTRRPTRHRLAKSIGLSPEEWLILVPGLDGGPPLHVPSFVAHEEVVRAELAARHGAKSRGTEVTKEPVRPVLTGGTDGDAPRR